MGFLRKGNPFRPLCGSEAGPIAGSSCRLLTCATGAWESFGAENHDDLDCLFAGMAGRVTKLVSMGGGGGLDRESWLPGSGWFVIVTDAASAGCDNVCAAL